MSGINIQKLQELISATASNGHGYVSATDGKPMMEHVPPLIEVNRDQQDGNGNAAARVTPAAQAYLDAHKGNAAARGQIVTGFVAPPAKRRVSPNAGAPSKYPFDQLDVGGSFFVGNFEVDKGDAFKTLSATVSSANRRYSEPTGETETVMRAKRGDDRKAILDAEGKKVMEQVTIEKRKALKHFKIVAVEGGVKYGEWTAPENGAIIIRDV